MIKLQKSNVVSVTLSLILAVRHSIDSVNYYFLTTAAFSTPHKNLSKRTLSTSLVSINSVFPHSGSTSRSNLYLSNITGEVDFNKNHSYRSNNSSGNKKERTKKRRFLQQAHPSPQKVKTENLHDVATIRNDDFERKRYHSVYKIGSSKNTDETLVSQSGGRVLSSDRPVQASKSIEELEAILEKRWGTGAVATAKTSRGLQNGSSLSNANARKKVGEDVDFVFSFDINKEYENDVSKSDTSKSLLSSNRKEIARFHTNRLLDPWAREDVAASHVQGKKEMKADKVLSLKGNESDLSTGFPQYSHQKLKRQDSMLNRVRAIQLRLQENKGIRKSIVGEVCEDVTQFTSDNQKYMVEDVLDASKYSVNDNEGNDFSSVTQRKKNIMSHNSVKGSKLISSESLLSRGLLSIPRLVDEAKPVSGEMALDGNVKKLRKKDSQSIPLLDEVGNEMFLTLEQADRIVQGILLSGKGENKYDEEEFTCTDWEKIGITNPILLSNLQSHDMTCPYPLAVQVKAIPPILAGNDVLLSTHTGSGKTLAFLLPIAHNILVDESRSDFPKAIIIAPGRELASQIYSVAQTLFRDTGMKVSMAIGGTSFLRNVETIRKVKPDVVVGTPGRMAELILGKSGEKNGKLKLAALQTIVLDECDALLRYDAHKEPTTAVLETLNRHHGESVQRVLCSATASDMMTSSGSEDLHVNRYLKKGFVHANIDDSDLLVTSGVKIANGGPVTTSAGVSRTTIHGTLHVPHQRLAIDAVRRILNTDPVIQQALIFVDSPRRVDIVIEKLAKMDIIAAPLHGGASSGKGDRSEVSKALREGYVGVVVATEMAARGLDAPYLTHVINLDLPTDASHYAHRAGRCGRGGRPGVAISITCDVREKGVPKKIAEQLGITMYNIEAREGKLKILRE